MVIIFVLLAIFALIGIRPQVKNKTNTFLDRTTTLSISGIFVVIIFSSHLFSYLDTSQFGTIDNLALFVISYLGQLVVAPFLFYSGFGVFEQFKNKGDNYTKTFWKKRIFKVYLSFLIGLILYFVLSMILNSQYSLSDYLLSFIGLSSIGNSNWYVFVILCLYIFSWLSFKISNGNKRYALISIILLSLTFYIVLQKCNLPFYWWNTIVAYVFGTIVSYKRNKIELLINKNRVWPYILTLSSGLMFVLSYYLFPKLFGPNDIFYVFCVVSFVSTIMFFTSILQIKNKLLIFLGSNAFWFYILQRLPMIIFSRYSLTSSNRYVFALLCILVTLVLVFVVGSVFKKAWTLFFEKHGETSETNNIRVGIVLSYAALFVSIVGGIFVTPKILNLLGDAQYGLYSFSTSITSWLAVISSALAASYIKFATDEKKELGSTKRANTVYFKIFAILAIFVFLILSVVLLALNISGFKLQQYSDKENALILWLLFISGIGVVVSLVFSVFSHYITYKKQFILTRTLSLVITIVTYILNLIFALATRSVVSIAIISVVLSLVSSIITMIACFKQQKMEFGKERLKDNKALISSIVVYSSFLILNSIVDLINNDVDKTILGIMVTAEAVAMYTLAKTFNSYLQTMSVSISGTFAPKVYDLVASNKKKELNDLFLKVSFAQLFVVCLVAGGFISCGYYFVKLWLGPERIDVYYYAIPFLILDVVSLSCNFGITVQRAMNKHKFRAVLYIILALINVGISILMVYLLPKDLAIYGVTIGTVFSVVLGNWIILNIYNHKVIGLPIGKYFIQVAKMVLITAVPVGASIGLNFLINNIGINDFIMLLITGITFVILYFGLLLIFERSKVQPIIKNIYKRFFHK